MPKVWGGTRSKIDHNPADIDLTAANASEMRGDGCILSLTVFDLSKPGVSDREGMKNCPVDAVPGTDGKIEGAAISLITADSGDELLDKIDKMELAEGMPHPQFHGSYA